MLVNAVIVALTLMRNGKCVTVNDECERPYRLGDTRRTTTNDPGTCGGICDNNIREGQSQDITLMAIIWVF